MYFRFVVAVVSLLHVSADAISQANSFPFVEEAPTSHAMTNDDVVTMVHAQFSDKTIMAVIDANDTSFDVRPAALVSLKSEGVSESVIEAMLAIETARRKAAPLSDDAHAAVDVAATSEPAPPAVEAEPPQSYPQSPESPQPQSVQATLPQEQPPPAQSPPIERFAAEPAAAVPSVPQLWRLEHDERIALPSSLAQVAFTDSRNNGMGGLRALQGLSSHKALIFASPALALANEIGGLFRSGDPTLTAVWALPGATAPRSVRGGAAFELDFSTIPGVNPDDYQPRVVQLLPTADNFRIVGAVRTKVSELDSGTPSEPIIEEPMAAHIERYERGRYRVALDEAMASGEYAIVLRPIEIRRNRRNAPASLGQLLGTGAGQLLYVTWEFSVVAPAVPPMEPLAE